MWPTLERPVSKWVRGCESGRNINMYGMLCSGFLLYLACVTFHEDATSPEGRLCSNKGDCHAYMYTCTCVICIVSLGSPVLERVVVWRRVR